MSGTKHGGLKCAETNKTLYGEDWYAQIGKKGGSKKGIRKGFALMDKEKLRAISIKGGSISRRGKKKKITFASSQKLWRITKELDEYYYEIRLAGVTIDRIRIEEPTLKFLKEKELL